MRLNTLIFLLTVLPLTAAAGPPAGGPDCDRSGPPHVQLLENAEAIGIDDDTYIAMVKLFEEMPTREEMASASESERELLHEDVRTTMDDALAMLTEEQLEAAREFLPPPPRGKNGERGPGGEDGPPQR